MRVPCQSPSVSSVPRLPPPLPWPLLCTQAPYYTGESYAAGMVGDESSSSTRRRGVRWRGGAFSRALNRSRDSSGGMGVEFTRPPSIKTPGVKTPGVQTPGVKTPGVKTPGAKTTSSAAVYLSYTRVAHQRGCVYSILPHPL